MYCFDYADAKEHTHAVGAKSMMEVANFIPSQLSVLGARVAAEQGLANFTTPKSNTVITNVPGSPVPFYSSGALFVRGWGLGPLVDGNGLFHSVGSYCDELYIGITCCRDMMPDCTVHPCRSADTGYRLRRPGRRDRKHPSRSKNCRQSDWQ